MEDLEVKLKDVHPKIAQLELTNMKLEDKVPLLLLYLY